MNLMVISSICLPPLIGTGVGYFTNWLAIKMLFRPYEKIVINLPILNKKMDLPFSPGLFPKEQEKLAYKVANIVTHQLLTTEDIRKIAMQFITAQNIEAGVDKIIDSILKEFQNIHKLRALSEEVAQLASLFIRESAPEIITDLAKNSPIVKELLNKTFDGIIIKAKIPFNKALHLTEYFFTNIATPNIIRNWLIQILTSENIEIINKLVHRNARGGYFLLSKVISAKSLLESTRDFLQNDAESANETIQDIINKVEIREKIANSISNIDFEKLPYSTVTTIREYFVELLINYIIENSKSVTEKFSTEEMTSIIADKIVHFNTSKVKTETLQHIKDEIASFINKYLENELGALVELAIPKLGINQIIIEKIITFSPKRLEEIITSIAKKELKGIQIIGGIIGFAIGLINSIIILITI